jgi:hypothetical protein
MHNGEIVSVHQMLHVKSTAQVLMKCGVDTLQQYPFGKIDFFSVSLIKTQFS